MKRFLINLAAFVFFMFLIICSFKMFTIFGILIAVMIALVGWVFLRHKWPRYF